VIHYTRNNPQTGQTEKYIGWQRSVCSWKGTDTKWTPIERKRFSNEELLEQVNEIKPVLDLV